MSYRGHGGYRAGDYYVPVRWRRRGRRGDLFDASGIDGTSFDPTAPSDGGGGTDTSLGTPDFSDVTGGSSTVPANVDYGVMGAGLPLQLPSFSGLASSGGSALGRALNFFGAGSSGPGVGAAVGTGAQAAGRAMVRAAIKRFGKRAAMAADTEVAPRRHMNPGNFKALRRSLRRLKSFEHAAKRVYSFTHRAPGRAKFKFPKRRRR